MKAIVLALTLTSALVLTSAAVLKNDGRGRVNSPIIIRKPSFDEFGKSNYVLVREKRLSQPSLFKSFDENTPTDFTQEPRYVPLRKGEYICGNKICKLKVGDRPCGDGICQYPIDPTAFK